VVKRLRFESLLVAAAMTLSASALAEPPDRAQAKAAYDRGLQAHKRGDHRKAAEEFARADALAPSAIALQAALDAAIEADDPVLGAELIERSKREPAPPKLAASITAAHMKFKGRAGRVQVVCPAGSTCTTKIDDQPVEKDKIAWARTGQRTVTVQVDGEPQTSVIDVNSEQVAVVNVSKSAPSAPPATASSDSVAPISPAPAPVPAPTSADSERPRSHTFGDGLPPIFFYSGVGLTVVLAGVTTYFAIDAANAHSSFESTGCTRANYAQCEGIKSDGEGSQTGANVALVLTGISAVATAVVGVRFTNWRGPLISARPGGGDLTWGATF
jgi:hypothetical protein